MKRHPKRTAKLYKWQRLAPDASEPEKDYVRSLTEGLEKSETIWELIGGLTAWLGSVATLERERQGSKIVLPGDDRWRIN